MRACYATRRARWPSPWRASVASTSSNPIRSRGEAVTRGATAWGHLIDPHLRAVRTREKEGDRVYRDALAALFDGGIDPMLIIRWKDVLEAIEEVIDRCRNAADLLGGILVKHSLVRWTAGLGFTQIALARAVIHDAVAPGRRARSMFGSSDG